VFDDTGAGFARLGDVADEDDRRAGLFANRMSACAEPRTWVTVPGADPTVSVHMV
jgi:hypothetical protein